MVRLKSFFVFVVIAFASMKFVVSLKGGGQLEVIVWGRQWGTAAIDYVDGIALDGKGNVYISGCTEGNLFEQNRGWRGDIFIVKINDNGDVIWSKQIGTPEDDHGNLIVVDKEGNAVYVITSTRGDWFGRNLGERDIVLLKFSTEGQLLLGKRLGTNKDDFAARIAVDAQGYVFILCQTTGSLFARYHERELESYEGVIAKLDPKGNVVWGRQFRNDTPHDIAIDHQGNIYLAGLTYDETDNTVDTYLAKLTPGGMEVWRQVKQNTEGESFIINSIGVDRDGKIYVAGRKDIYVDENKLYAIPDALIACYDGVSGQRLWLKRFSSQEQRGTRFIDITINGQGSIYVVGKAESRLFGDHLGDGDVVIAKIDALGNVIWGKQWGTDKEEVGGGIIIDTQGSIYIAGRTNGNLFGTNAGESDVFVIKLRQ